MSQLKARCIDQVLTFENTPVIASGDVNYDSIMFDFCSAWDGYTKTAIFYRSEDEVYYRLLDKANTCIIPNEVLTDKGDIFIGVFGVSGDTTITSQVLKYKITKGAITENLKPSDPTPDIYAQIISRYDAIIEELERQFQKLEDLQSQYDGSVGNANKLNGFSSKQVGESGARNLLKYPYYSTTMLSNGIEWTDNGDGTVSAKGTNATDGQNLFSCRTRVENNGLILKPGTYTVSGCPSGGGPSTYYIQVGRTVNGAYSSLGIDYGKGVTFTLTEDTQIQYQPVVAKNATVDIVFKPMLEYGSVIHDYVLYYTGGSENSNKLNGFNAQEVGESGVRNILPYPYFETTHSENGITFTDNGDGTIHVKGTATGSANFTVRATSEVWLLEKGDYVLSGCPVGGSFSTYRLQVARFVDSTLTSYANEYGTGATFTVTDETALLIQFVVASGVTIDATIKPMLIRGSVKHEYIPYHDGGAKHAKTADRALMLRDYGPEQLYKSARILTSADDLDTLFELGLYYYTSSDIPQNAPYQNASFVEVIRFNDNRQIQRVTRAGVSGYQTERVYSGSWQAWTYDINDSNVSNYALTPNNFANYALPINGGGTVSFTDYTSFKVKRNTDTDSAGVGITFANNNGNVGMIGFKNKKLVRTDVSTWSEYEVLDVGNSVKVCIGDTAPSDTSSLWIDTTA